MTHAADPAAIAATVPGPAAPGGVPRESAGALRVALNASLLTIGRLAGDGLSFLFFLVVARAYGPEGSGHYSYAFAVAGLVATLANPLLQDYGVRSLARTAPAARARAFAPVLVLQLALAALAALALVLYLALGAPSRDEVLLATAFSAFLGAFALAGTLFVPAYADEAMSGPALAELATRAAAIAGALALALLAGASLPAAALAFPLAAPLVLALALASARARLGALSLATSGGEVAAALLQVWPIALAELVGQVHVRADVILLAHLAGEAETGRYAAALKLVEVGTAPLIFLVTAAFPRLSRGHAEGTAAFAPVAAGVLRATLALGGALALAFCFLLPPLVVPALGERFAGTADILPWMGVRAALLALEIALLRLLIASDRQAVLLRWLAAGTVLNLALNYVLIPPLGASGAVAAGTATLAVICLGYGLALSPSLALRVQAGLVARFALSLAAGVGAGLAAAAHLGALGAFPAALLAYAAATWATGLATLRRPARAAAAPPA